MLLRLTKEKKISYIIDFFILIIILSVIYLFLKFLLPYLIPLIFAYLISSIIHQIIKRLNNIFKVNKKLTTLILFCFILFIMGLITFFTLKATITFLKFTAVYLSDTLIPLLNNVFAVTKRFLANLPSYYNLEITELETFITNSLSSLLISLSKKGIDLAKMSKGLADSFLTALVTIILTFLVTVNYETINKSIAGFMPKRVKLFFCEIKTIFKTTIFKYIEANIILTTIVFIESFFGLLIIDKDKAWLYAVIISVFDLLPVFGAGLVFIPQIIIEAFSMNYNTAVKLSVLYLIILISKNILEAKIIGDKLGLHPILSILSIYIGFRLIGVLGGIIMPIAVMFAIRIYSKYHNKAKNECVSNDINTHHAS